MITINVICWLFGRAGLAEYFYSVNNNSQFIKMFCSSDDSIIAYTFAITWWFLVVHILWQIDLQNHSEIGFSFIHKHETSSDDCTW